MIEFAFYSAHSGKPPGNLDVSYDLNSTLKRALWLLHGGWSVGRQGQRQGGEGEVGSRRTGVVEWQVMGSREARLLVLSTP